jgi:hypothetical protein
MVDSTGWYDLSRESAGLEHPLILKGPFHNDGIFGTFVDGDVDLSRVDLLFLLNQLFANLSCGAEESMQLSEQLQRFD